jgi:hypothetical protein
MGPPKHGLYAHIQGIIISLTKQTDLRVSHAILIFPNCIFIRIVLILLFVAATESLSMMLWW